MRTPIIRGRPGTASTARGDDGNDRSAPGDVFGAIYRRNSWGGYSSVSGRGSGLDQTRRLIRLLPALFRTYDITTVLDLPCGDFHWMQHVDRRGVCYAGADIVPELVAANHARHAAPGTEFRCLDLLRDPLPEVDLVVCRDCLVHLPLGDVSRALANVRASGSRYLLTTTFTGGRINVDIETGGWRPLDLQRPPFHLPPPLRVLREGCTEFGGSYADKSLGLWKVVDLPHPQCPAACAR
ncbi:MAG: class I SAM-dependent methyltransferase [Anaerolineales bacterium]|nr:class I SAM-dependent methyltransferase [Anaerolineales bacterium]